MKRSIILFFLLVIACLDGMAQEEAHVEEKCSSIVSGVDLTLEAAGTFGNGEYAPLWLTSNRYGIVSPYSNSGYQRAYLHRDLENDSCRTWQWGYGVDVVAAEHAQSSLMLHQAYVQVKYMNLQLILGMRERELELRNQQLSSGSMVYGINAQPLPMVAFKLDYTSVPFTRHLLKFKGRFGYGRQTDDAWQKRWLGDTESMKYNEGTLYHEKSIFAKIGKEEVCPLVFELGLQMAAFFGGTSYNVEGRNYHSGEPLKHSEDFKAFWDAFWPLYTSGEMDGVNQGTAGNQMGSYLGALAWKDKDWSARVYYEHFFETGNNMIFHYGFRDHIIGLEASLPKNPYVSSIVVENVVTKDQSGPIFHDPTANVSEHISGITNFYNHNIYNGYQHWGMSMGTPFITSPIYNDDHAMIFRNNRVKAWHLGLSGEPCRQLSWRMMMSFTKNWGTYYRPFHDVLSQNSFLLEADYHPEWSKGITSKLGLGFDDGKLLGSRYGVQLTFAKRFRLM